MVGPYGGGPGFRRQTPTGVGGLTQNPRGSGGFEGGMQSPAPRPMGPPSPSIQGRPTMFPGAQNPGNPGIMGRPLGAGRPYMPVGGGQLDSSRSLNSPGGFRKTPYENYVASGPEDRMNLQEFRQAGMAPQYSNLNVMRQANGMEPLTPEQMKQMAAQRQTSGGGGFQTPYGQYRSDYAANPGIAPAMSRPEFWQSGAAQSYTPQREPRPTRTYELPVPPWAVYTPPSPQPVPPQTQYNPYLAGQLR